MAYQNCGVPKLRCLPEARLGLGVSPYFGHGIGFPSLVPVLYYSTPRQNRF